MKQARPWKHVFRADDFSITDPALSDGALPSRGSALAERIAGTRQTTDVYLAAMALRRGGRLVTFDSGVAWQAIEGGSKELIEVPALWAARADASAGNVMGNPRACGV